MQSSVDGTEMAWPRKAEWDKLDSDYGIKKEDVMSKIKEDDDRWYDTIITEIYGQLKDYYNNKKEEGSEDSYVETLTHPIMLELFSTFPGDLGIPIPRHSYNTVADTTDSSYIMKQRSNLSAGFYALGEVTETPVLTVPYFLVGMNVSAGRINGGYIIPSQSDELFFQHTFRIVQTIIKSCPDTMVVTLLYVDMLRLNRDMEVLKERFLKLEGVRANVRFMRQYMDSNKMLSLLDTLIEKQQELQDVALGNHKDAAEPLRRGLDKGVVDIQDTIGNDVHATKGEMKKVGTSARIWLVDGAANGEELKNGMAPIIEKEKDYIIKTLKSAREAKTENVRTIASEFGRKMRGKYKGVIKRPEERVGLSYSRMTEDENRDTIELNNCNHSLHQNSMAKAYFETLEKVDAGFTAPSSVAVISTTRSRHLVNFDELRDGYVLVCLLVALGQLSDLATTLTPRISSIENLFEFVLCLCEDPEIGTTYHQSWGHGIDPRKVAALEAKRIEVNEESLIKTLNKVDISGELAEGMRGMSFLDKRCLVEYETDEEEEGDGMFKCKKAKA